MKQPIILKSFSALSFDLIVRHAPVQTMHSPPPPPKHRLACPPDGDLPVAARRVVDSTAPKRPGAYWIAAHRS
ncbi:MAG: hypothetical protein IH623_10800 [Verrucomicrobia bacterium]|nr:hypothetical protein [Verrucomicrobiota bacterium]